MADSTPREILVVHNDLTDKLGRLTAASLKGCGFPVSYRNVRYGYHSQFYLIVVAIGVEAEIEVRRNTYCFDYLPYKEYIDEVASLTKPTFSEYLNEQAEVIAEDILNMFDRD